MSIGVNPYYHYHDVEINSGSSELAKELVSLAREITDENLQRKILDAGASIIADEIRNQIDMKAKYTHPYYKNGKREKHQLNKNFQMEFVDIGKDSAMVRLGFTKMGAHSNILEHSRKKVLRHFAPAWALKKDEAISKMLTEARACIDKHVD